MSDLSLQLAIGLGLIGGLLILLVGRYASGIRRGWARPHKGHR